MIVNVSKLTCWTPLMEHEMSSGKASGKLTSQNNTDVYEKALAIAQGDRADVKVVYAMLDEARVAGDRRAAYAIATWCLHGQPPLIEKSPEKAVELLRESGRVVSSAAFDLAVCYEMGVGTPKDLIRAFRWYMQAALLGDAQSYFEVGRCFYYGIGTKAMPGLAEPWYQKADELGVYERDTEFPRTAASE